MNQQQVDADETKKHVGVCEIVKNGPSREAVEAVRRLCDMQAKSEAMDRVLASWGMT